MAQIVEIAIRALSIAINDTFTGVACVDLLGAALTVLAAAPKNNECSFDEAGTIRLQVRPILVSRLIKQAFDQFRQAAAGNPAVSIRILSTIGRLGATMSDREQIDTLKAQALAVWESAASKSPVATDRKDLEEALAKARSLLSENEHNELP